MLNSLFSKYDNIVVLDIETTGLNPKDDEIIELGAIHVTQKTEPYHIENELDSLVELSSGRSLPEIVVKLTGITEEQLSKQGKPKAEISKELVKILDNKNTLLVAYNAQFDLSFIYYFLHRYQSADVLKKLKLLDAMTIYKDRRDYPHKLENAVAAYNIENENAHRAIDDAKATLKLLAQMSLEKDDLDRYINLFGYNAKYGISGAKISSVKYLPQNFDRKQALYD